ncbi:hypothetical protein [Corallococcus sp. AB038B]|uniref:hypothetical protein n=1 Tax=Corallococcus sp. AB038B TaxID=2316718 RepID=UPI000EC625E1|nr:hypothetical protein [Corallococcus sp. AB038B]RKH95670.1 hypothetical protein D7Y04_32175 [Corallococcus sp. AB038B]
MHRLIALAVLLCVACGDKTDPPTHASDAGTEGPATLIVHSDWWDFVAGLGDMQGITVLLGDGSRFRQPLGRDGIARFHDAAITGPQDITVVMVGDGKVWASTTLNVEGTEVWVRSGFGLLGGGFPGSRQATLAGRVTNLSGRPAQVRVVGKGFAGVTNTQGDGTFIIEVWGETAGEVALFVTDNPQQVSAVGLLRDIAVGEGRTTSGLVIPLDHPVDQRLPVEVTNLQPYGALSSVTATFSLGSEYLFTTSTVGATPIEVPAMARTPPFDTVDVRLSATAGSDERIASGRVVANAPLFAKGVTSLALPAPVTLTSPSPGTKAAPGSGPRSGLTLRWSADPAVHSVTIRMIPQQAPELDWYVTAPATVGSFSPFILPAEVSPLRELGAGRYFVQWSSRSLGMGHGYQDLYKEAPSVFEPDSWSSNTYGYSVLQD